MKLALLSKPLKWKEEKAVEMFGRMTLGEKSFVLLQSITLRGRYAHLVLGVCLALAMVTWLFLNQQKQLPKPPSRCVPNRGQEGQGQLYGNKSRKIGTTVNLRQKKKMWERSENNNKKLNLRFQDTSRSSQ